MNESFLIPRLVENRDWAIVIFLGCLALIALTRSVFETRFAEFSKLGISDKYIKVYRDNGSLMSWFNVSLFVIHLVSLAFFIQIAFYNFGFGQKGDWLLFIRIFGLLGVFILCKYLIEKIIASSFNIEEFVEQFNLQKVSYRTYIGLLLLPVDIILYFSSGTSKTVIFAIIGSILIINVLTYAISLRNYQNILLGKLFYFILYLCALEIAPYYFMYYWFTKS
ncbi:DUF4271 domain-containing protein [Flavobacterium selenitireducens]|uniref:DUF4271 domain-containing protein n=1 Tax=Flavobacterium selenitireducens TaxID=2722704 RepID=UPI00168A6BF1|nr:DUF4271 domain-containing protein [Flavobacterium selenitireducens]MBD3581968.1 DUF4271 domain-containing protein [Flavobacterium selenitireducens]